MRILILITILALACLSIAHAAPAPLARVQKPEVPAWLVGRWVMHWGDITYDTTLSRDGSYSAVAAQTYVGTWELRGRHLVIRERIAGQEGLGLTMFALDLGGDLAGTIDEGCYRGTYLRLARPRVTD